MPKYSKKIVQLVQAPEKAGSAELLEQGYQLGEADASQNGEHVRFYVLFDAEKIEDCRFQAQGGVVVMALCEYVAQLAVGKTRKQLRAYSGADWLNPLELSQQYIHAAELVRKALNSALNQ